MGLREILRELNAEDGPNIPQRTLSVYCGIDQSVISKYIRGRNVVGKEKEEMALRGLRELAAEINQIVNGE